MISMVLAEIESAKNSLICISRFFGGGQSRREIIFRRLERKPLQVLVGKKSCAIAFINKIVGCESGF